MASDGFFESLKILLVDDTPTSLQMMVDVFENFGCEVVSASNGLEAFELACQHRFDVIFTDHTMPQMSGVELYEKLREQGNVTPMVLVTGVHRHSIGEYNVVPPPLHFIEKPFRLAHLKELMMEVLEVAS